jgi:uncharacterized membrane protein
VTAAGLGGVAPDPVLRAVTIVALLGAGLVAGVFFAFSAFVMAALERLPSARGVAAMQSINRIVIKPAFLGLFLGTALPCAALLLLALVGHAPGREVALVFGALACLAGTVGVTLRANVPRNEALARLDPATAEATAYWPRYLREWTRWNHLRCAASLAAAAAFAVALC